MKENLDLKYENLRLVKSSSSLKPDDVENARSKLAVKYKEIDDIICGLISTTPHQELVEEASGPITCYNRQRSNSRLSDCIDEVSETSDTSSRPISGRATTDGRTSLEPNAMTESLKSTEKMDFADSLEAAASMVEPMLVMEPSSAPADKASTITKKRASKTKNMKNLDQENGSRSPKPGKTGLRTPSSGSERPKKRVRGSGTESPNVIISNSPFALTPSPSQKPVKKLLAKKYKAASPLLSQNRQPLAIKSPNKLAVISPLKEKSPIKARRSRSTQVNYALPSLRTKMRRPTEKLADAVTVMLDKEN